MGETKTKDPRVEVVARVGPVGGEFDQGQMNRGFGARVMRLLDRTGLGSLMGQTHAGNRDLYDAFGWHKSITIQQLHDMFNRGGIARRIATAYPDATWGRPPRLYLPENPDWSQQFAKLAWDLDLWAHLHKVDVLANLGRYSIMLIGTNRGALDQPIPRGGAGSLQITYLQPYSEARVKIKTWDKEPRSPRFGLPVLYTISPVSSLRNATNTISEGDDAPQGSAFDVHYSRVIHVAKGGLESRIYGVPDYAASWNYLVDLMKVIGASSESYWLTAYPGLHMNVDKDMDLDDEDEANLTAEMDDYIHRLRRFIRTRGVEVEAIGSKVADPRGAFDVLITLISGTTGIPKRILLGSESGQLASSQDKASWAERVEENREMHAEPNVLWPFVMWCIDNGLTPMPGGTDIRSLRALWPDAYRMSPLEKGQQAAQTARSLANIMKGMEPVVTKRGTEEIRDPTTGEVVQPGSPDETTDPLISRDEARRIIGLSTDQALLAEYPEDNE